MAKPNEITVTSLSAFTDAVEKTLQKSRAKFKGQEGLPELHANWYRGVGNADKHALVPSLYRHSDPVDKLLDMEIRMMDWFRSRSSMFDEVKALEGILLGTSIEPLKRIGLLFFMQHYRVPTRVLDWTENPFIALYFALTSAPYDADKKVYAAPAAVWILDPVAWNKKSLGETWGAKGPMSRESDQVKGYAPKGEDGAGVTQKEAAAIYGIYNNVRIAAQRGVFTIFGKHNDAMETTFDKKDYPADCLIKLVIPKDQITNLLDTVIALGFTDSATYPDLFGLALEIRRNFGFPG